MLIVNSSYLCAKRTYRNRPTFYENSRAPINELPRPAKLAAIMDAYFGSECDCAANRWIRHSDKRAFGRSCWLSVFSYNGICRNKICHVPLVWRSRVLPGPCWFITRTYWWAGQPDSRPKYSVKFEYVRFGVSQWNIIAVRTVISGISAATVRTGQQTASILSSQKGFRRISKSAMNVSRWIEPASAENPSFPTGVSNENRNGTFCRDAATSSAAIVLSTIHRFALTKVKL